MLNWAKPVYASFFQRFVRKNPSSELARLGRHLDRYQVGNCPGSPRLPSLQIDHYFRKAVIQSFYSRSVRSSHPQIEWNSQLRTRPTISISASILDTPQRSHRTPNDNYDLLLRHRFKAAPPRNSEAIIALAGSGTSPPLLADGV